MPLGCCKEALNGFQRALLILTHPHVLQNKKASSRMEFIGFAEPVSRAIPRNEAYDSIAGESLFAAG